MAWSQQLVLVHGLGHCLDSGFQVARSAHKILEQSAEERQYQRPFFSSFVQKLGPWKSFCSPFSALIFSTSSLTFFIFYCANSCFVSSLLRGRRMYVQCVRVLDGDRESDYIQVRSEESN